MESLVPNREMTIEEIMLARLKKHKLRNRRSAEAASQEGPPAKRDFSKLGNIESIALHGPRIKFS